MNIFKNFFDKKTCEHKWIYQDSANYHRINYDRIKTKDYSKVLFCDSSQWVYKIDDSEIKVYSHPLIISILDILEYLKFPKYISDANKYLKTDKRIDFNDYWTAFKRLLNDQEYIHKADVDEICFYCKKVKLWNRDIKKEDVLDPITFEDTFKIVLEKKKEEFYKNKEILLKTYKNKVSKVQK